MTLLNKGVTPSLPLSFWATLVQPFIVSSLRFTLFSILFVHNYLKKNSGIYCKDRKTRILFKKSFFLFKLKFMSSVDFSFSLKWNNVLFNWICLYIFWHSWLRKNTLKESLPFSIFHYLFQKLKLKTVATFCTRVLN